MTHSHFPVQHLIKQVELYRSKRNNRDVRPEWVGRFIDRMAELFDPADDVARVGFECQPDEEGWQIGLYLGRTEIVGGRADGESRHSNFEFDLRGILDEFERIERFSWTALTDATAQTPHSAGFVTILGYVDGNLVRLRIYSAPPTDAGPAFREFPNGERTAV